ncbi:hypothetical protein MFIFM68171_06753 [Madurella fahalii]|uniref:Heterokaryon incompatibility domain-containing protein n=1 Tax=Madurella fahalii TaxID=1157608 RepID=A0ABQ0GFK1_9PEZI
MEFLKKLSLRNTYSYEPLPHSRAIRLIRLVPNLKQTCGFSLSLRIVSVDNPGKFCALSYTWRSPTTTSPDETGDNEEAPAMVAVECDGKELYVTENAFDFLQYAFHGGIFLADHHARSEADVYLWIDAISINQADLEERSCQVSLMGDVYQSSRGTIVWLGKEDPHPGARWVMQTFIPSFLALSRVNGRDFFIAKSPLCTDPALVQHFGEEVCARWRQELPFFFLFLLRHRWFHRGWVVQEVVLKGIKDQDAILVICGSFSMPWAQLLSFLTILSAADWRRSLTSHIRSLPEIGRYGRQLSTAFQMLHSTSVLQNHLRACSQGEILPSLSWRYGTMTDTERVYALFFETVYHMRGRRFTDKRDVIYACLGLLSCLGRSASRIMNADYRISPAEVYTRAAWAMLNTMARLDLLNTIEVRRTDASKNLPSWVPDFNVTANPTRFSNIQHAFSQAVGFGALKRQSPSSSYRLIGEKTLALQGVMVSTVSKRGPLLNMKDPSNVHFEWFLEALVRHQGNYTQTCQTPAEALSRTLVANICPDALDELQYKAAFRTWWSKHLAQRIRLLEATCPGNSKRITDLLGQLGADQEWLPSLTEVLSRVADESSEADSVDVAYLDTIRYRIWCLRRVVLTDDGRFGIGPCTMCPTDQIWLLDGGRTPFILRKKASGDGYIILGEVYIHGVMYGELATTELLSQMGEVRIH